MSVSAEAVATALPAATHTGPVALAVADLPGLAAWYRAVLGLERLAGDERRAVLGAADGRPLLVLERRPDLEAEDPRRAGLFHVAFLLPSRLELGRWVAHLARHRHPIEGASDHLVSEALYLSDPEGNGIEVYRDRPRGEWPMEGPRVKMDTLAADLRGLLAEGQALEPFDRMPAGSVVGHVHLKVADLDASRRFYLDTLGLDLMATYPGALFVAAGGYHHHLGLNVWRSAERRRAAESLGLSVATLVTGDAAALPGLAARLDEAGYPTTAVPDGFDVIDPAGNRLRLLASDPSLADLVG